MVSNKGLVYKKLPQYMPVIGEHIALEDRLFDLETAPPPDGLTVKLLYIVFDPYQRGGMRDPDTATYFPPYGLGQPLMNWGVAKVLKSNSLNFKEGDVVIGMFGMEEYFAVPAPMMPMVRPAINPYNLDLKLFLGPLGVAGLSAYSSMYEYAKPKKGETIFISAASGGVGQIAGQIAKIEGLTVIGSVGSDEKLKFITEELGFDAGFNYKKEKASGALAKLAPKGLDIYYDNVGGEQLEAAIDAMKDFGRIVVSGMISQYNTPESERYGVRNLMNIFLKRLSIQGFIVSDPHIIAKYMVDLQTTMGGWLAEGKVKSRETIVHGIDHAPDAFLGMFNGRTFGKTILEVSGLK